MTNQIEQEFYKTFDIPKMHLEFEDDIGKYHSREKIYPPITDRILLELICTLNVHNPDFILYSETLDELKDDILLGCIKAEDSLVDTWRIPFIKAVRKIMGVETKGD